MQTIGHKAFVELRFEDAHSARSRMALELDGGDVRGIEEGRAASLGERREGACVSSARKVIIKRHSS